MLLDNAIEEFLLELDIKGASKETIRNYTNALKVFKEFMADNYNINNIKAIHIKEFAKFNKDRGLIQGEFDNVNPDEYNASLESNKSNNNTSSKVYNTTNNNSKNENQSSSSKVYWTPNGKSYHTTKNCSTLSRSKTILEGTVSSSGKHETGEYDIDIVLICLNCYVVTDEEGNYQLMIKL